MWWDGIYFRTAAGAFCFFPLVEADIVEQLQRGQLVVGVGVVPGGPDRSVVVHLVVDCRAACAGDTESASVGAAAGPVKFALTHGRSASNRRPTIPVAAQSGWSSSPSAAGERVARWPGLVVLVRGS